MKKLLIATIVVFFTVECASAQNYWTLSGTTISNNNTGPVRIGTTANTLSLAVQGTGTLGSAYVFNVNDGTRYLFGSVNTTAAELQSNGVPLYVNWAGNNTIINGQFGKVGIGTTTPTSSLEVNTGTNGSATGLVLNNNNANLSSARIFFSNSTDITTNSFAIYKSGNNLLFNYNGAPITNNGTTGMMMTNTGQIGINTTTLATGFQLSVNGSVMATAMTVQPKSAWPDYVFKKNYALPSLYLVENYVARNHHLPELPSAATVAAKGLDLGQMNQLLTKKVEELTLYLIQQDKQIKSDEDQIKAQNERIQKLEQEMQMLLKKGK